MRACLASSRATLSAIFSPASGSSLLIPAVPTLAALRRSSSARLLSATAAYLGAHFGPGPRDGLMTGLVRRPGRSVRLVRTIIEGSVLLSGFLLRSEEHTSELQSLMRTSYAVF